MSEWMSIQESQPREYRHVIFYGDGYFSTGDYSSGKVNIDRKFIPDIKITHWMPLPAPPQDPTDPLQYAPCKGWRS